MDPVTLTSRNTNQNQAPVQELSEHTSPNQSHEQDEPKGQKTSFFGEVLRFAFLAFIIVLPFRLLVAQPFIVSGASMSPTFETGEYLIVDQLTYRFEEPERGDVVIFRFPNDPSKYFIKRIIGLPGEIVQLANGVTTIIQPSTQTEIILDEEYLITDKTDDHISITLSSDEYFVMGDNRSASSDSRVWGPVPRENIVGRALLRLLPLQTASVFPGSYMYTPAEIHNLSDENM